MNTQSNSSDFDVQMRKLLSPQNGFDFMQPKRPMTEAEMEEAKEQERILHIWCKSCEKD